MSPLSFKIPTTWSSWPARLSLVLAAAGWAPAAGADTAASPPIHPNWSVLAPYLESGVLTEDVWPRLKSASPVEVLEWGEHQVFLGTAQLPRCAYPVSLEPPPEPDSLDALHYDLHVTELNYAEKFMSAEAVVSLRALSSVNRVELHLEELSVSSVQIDTGGGWAPAAFEHADGLLRIPLTEAANPGDEIQVRVVYSGYPTCTGAFKETAVVFDDRGIHTFCQPTYARHWFPGIDLPHDKATYRLTLDVPPGWSASATGALVSSEPLGGGTRMQWVLEQPAATYLVAFYVGDYVHESEVSPGGIPVHYHTFPDLQQAVAVDWENTPDMLDFFSAITPYGFDLYQNTSAPFAGGMEHQTNSMMGLAVTPGNKGFEWVLAHEIAHQWWGDLITPASWKHIWLNEGFATYFDLMYTEHKYGTAEFAERLAQTEDGYYLLDSLRTARDLPRHALLNMPSDRLFTTDVYNKGAFVLHMLRALFWMQEAPSGLFTSDQYRQAQARGLNGFLDVFRRYAEDHAYESADSDDFQNAAESVFGEDLDWFFDQWLEEPGFPELRYQVEPDASDDPRPAGVTLRLRQVQIEAPVFRLPVHTAYVVGPDTLHAVHWLEGEEGVYSEFLPAKPERVLLDPDNWLLEKQEESEVAAPSRNGMEVTPNPSPSGFGLRLQVQAEGFVQGTFRIFDGRGRLVRSRPVAFTGPGVMPLYWDGASEDGTPAAAGVYFAKVVVGGETYASRLVVVGR